MSKIEEVRSDEIEETKRNSMMIFCIADEKLVSN